MALNDTKAQISFRNLNVTYANTQLVGDIDQQITRIQESDARRRAFRTDLMMLGEGDLWVSNSLLENRDFLIVSGMLNYAQALTHRLVTPRGYHPADPSFGVPWYSYLGISYTSKSVMQGQLIADITEELIKDSRTGAVLSVTVDFQSPTVITTSCNVVPINIRDDMITLSLTAVA